MSDAEVSKLILEGFEGERNTTLTVCQSMRFCSEEVTMGWSVMLGNVPYVKGEDRLLALCTLMHTFIEPAQDGEI